MLFLMGKYRSRVGALVAVLASCGVASGCSNGEKNPAPPRNGGSVYPDGSVEPTAACKPEGGSASPQAPVFVRNVKSDTGWYSSPAIAVLNDGVTSTRALVVPSYSIDVYSASGERLSHVPEGQAIQGRIYPPAPLGDIDQDGRTELVVGGSKGTAAAYEWRGAQGFVLEPGWQSASTCSGGDCPETRGLAAADLDQDGTIEIVFTTTNTSPTGAQVFVFAADGSIYQPAGLTAWQAWPRYNIESGTGNDADFNGQGNHGYGG
jgi:hypothetical protein